MAILNVGSLPLTIRLGADKEAEITVGTIHIPLHHVGGPGNWTLSVDHAELRKRLAEGLREAADRIENPDS